MAEPAPQKRRATYEDVLRAPENMVAEVLGGELHVSPRPASPHALATSYMGSPLIGRFGGPPNGPDAPGGWWILFEPELHLGEDVVVPDLAGWRRERMSVVPDVPFFSLAPDWVCEVVSPSTARRDRMIKLDIYARESVRHAWLVDPLARVVEVFRLDAGKWTRAATAGAPAEKARLEPFDAVELEIARWWPGPEEPPAP